MSRLLGLTEREIFSLITTGDKPLLERKYFDDAAVIPTQNSGSLVIASDFIRGPHFNLAEAGHLSFFDLAHYLVAANVSDIAAMGVKPFGLLDIFRYPKDTPAHIKEEFFAGLADAAKRFDVRIVGGDTGGYVSFVISATCFGFAQGGRILKRNAAAPGQILCLAGSAGRCRAAQKALLGVGSRPVSSDIAERLLGSWRRPSPPIDFSVWLATNSLAYAGQDTSDGLGNAIADICEHSGLQIRLEDIDHLVDDDVRHVAECFEVSALELAMSVSPDFGLLFSANEEDLDSIRANPFEQAVTELGKFQKGDGAYLLSDALGTRKLPLESYDHLHNLKS
ncbi:thiamine-monophosphate kinase [Roseibium sp. MMSF_3544]|uniref:thiamine-phosphate kinase n=1 Tax=unclassified Roseibium TaxID=2629323 RepID=UPI00273D3371|nr:thiamine-phosphate kinase [Roseibium sp. MMSF_3544]